MDYIDSIGYAFLVLLGIGVVAFVDHWLAWVPGLALITVGGSLPWRGRDLFARPNPPIIEE